MIWYILALVIVFLVSLSFRIKDYRYFRRDGKKSWYGKDDVVMDAVWPVIIAIIPIFVIMIALSFIPDNTIGKISCWNLVSIDDSTTTSGHFFLGSGTLKSDPVYYYYYHDGAGFKRSYINAQHSTIYYGPPHICEIGSHKNIWTNPIMPAVFEHNSYDIYVPPGTIKSNYILDNQN